MANNIEDIGKRIRQIRKTAKISQVTLGKALGISGAAVSKYENGDSDAGAINLAKIAETGNVSLDWLITGKEPQQKKAQLTTEQLFAGAINNPEFMQKISAAVRQTADTPATGEPLKKAEHELLENYRIISEDLQSAAQSMIKAWAIESRENAGGGSDLRAKKLA